MNLKNAITNISRSHEKDRIHDLYTPWGEQLDPEHVWQEYPRPQMKRKHYHMLNGYWDYSFASTPDTFTAEGKILVPFSPESLLSGVGRQLKPTEHLWYQRSISLDVPKHPSHRCILHFGAVDQTATVYVNGYTVTTHHGGYLPFSVDITNRIKNCVTQELSSEPVLLQVEVTDVSDTSYHSRGKQTLQRGGMFYTAQSGIWQSVWYEWVPENHIVSMKLTPDYDTRTCEIVLTTKHPIEKLSLSMNDTLSYPVLHRTDTTDTTCIVIGLPEDIPFQPWTPETPYLYPLQITADEDQVESYFAMRCYSIEKDHDNIPRFCLNHKPLFLHGILDQGYWPDGLMTAPCDEAFVFDIELAKSFGFNMIRKHIKIEPLRWYYHCDRLGMIVWQDIVNGGASYHMSYVCYLPTLFPGCGKRLKDNHYRLLARSNKNGRTEWLQECLDTMHHLHNVPSLAVWGPFNEAWGQFDAAAVYDMMHKEDPTRPIDHASGWFDQGCGQFRSVHNYFRKLTVEKESERAFAISEYGGYACHLPGHSSVDRCYGYQKYENCQTLSAAYHQLMNEKLLPLEKKGLSAAVYTQLSDIEEEVNGLVTYDRKVVKIK